MAKGTNLKCEAFRSVLRVFLNKCYGDEINRDKMEEILSTRERYDGGIRRSFVRNPEEKRLLGRPRRRW
jgi:hypothetical protein